MASNDDQQTYAKRKKLCDVKFEQLNKCSFERDQKQ